jgi:spastic paraplegia protein 7
LKENKDKLEKLAELLLLKETLNFEDVEELLGPPPFGKKHLVSPVEYEEGLKQRVKEIEEQEKKGT